MTQIEVHYDNGDMQFSREAEIAAIVENNAGEVDGTGQCLESNQRDILAVFPDDKHAMSAVEELLAAGIEAELSNKDSNAFNAGWG